MNFYLDTIKELSVLSLILGAILGLATLIPYVGIITFLMCTFASGCIIILYMQKMKLLGELDVKDWAINGAISGLISFLGFSLAFIPLAVIIGELTKASYYYGIAIMFKSGFFMLVFMIIFIAITSAITNSFGAMTTAYAIKVYKSQLEKK